MRTTTPLSHERPCGYAGLHDCCTSERSDLPQRPSRQSRVTAMRSTFRLINARLSPRTPRQILCAEVLGTFPMYSPRSKSSRAETPSIMSRVVVVHGSSKAAGRQLGDCRRAPPIHPSHNRHRYNPHPSRAGTVCRKTCDRRSNRTGLGKTCDRRSRISAWGKTGARSKSPVEGKTGDRRSRTPAF
jgi:hypothetical protein